MHLSEMDVVYVGVQISLLGFSLFIGAISFSAWRYPLKENCVFIHSRQLCNSIESIYMLLRNYIKTSQLRNSVMA